MELIEVPLDYELPSRRWFRTQHGIAGQPDLWGSEEWTKETRAEAEANRYKLVDARRFK